MKEQNTLALKTEKQFQRAAADVVEYMLRNGIPRIYIPRLYGVSMRLELMEDKERVSHG